MYNICTYVHMWWISLVKFVPEYNFSHRGRIFLSFFAQVLIINMLWMSGRMIESEGKFSVADIWNHFQFSTDVGDHASTVDTIWF